MTVKSKLPKSLVSASVLDNFVVKIERERKFLVNSWKMPDLDQYPHKNLLQSYFKDESTGHWIRARRIGDGDDSKYIVTIKKPVPGGNDIYEKREAEKDIDAEQFNRLLRLSERRELNKTRYWIPYGDHTIELDVYHDGNGIASLHGLITAEVEFKNMTELEKFTPPDWFGMEVSADVMYRSRKLAKYGIPKDYLQKTIRRIANLLRED